MSWHETKLPWSSQSLLKCFPNHECGFCFKILSIFFTLRKNCEKFSLDPCSHFSLFSYWMIVRKRLRDHAHLLVMFALCGKLRKWEELMNSLWKENSAQYIRLLVENRSVTQKRNLLGKRIQRLEEASLVLNSISLEP